MIFSERYSYDPEKDAIGKGGFSKIYKAYDNLREETIALKFFHGEVDEKYGMIAEAKRLLKLEHKNVIRFFDLETVEFVNIHMRKEDGLVGVLEYIDGGDLKSAMSDALSIEQKIEIAKGILEGLAYIHSKKLIHRDLKPGNVMLHYNGGEVTPKLIDFGISKEAEDGTTSSSQLLGTVEYMAPEQFNPEKYGKVSIQTDLWSFGVIMHELFAGKKLFGSRGTGQQTEQVISKILLDEMPVSFEGVPENVANVLRQCLERDPRNRVQSAKALIETIDELQENGNKPAPKTVSSIKKELKDTPVLEQSESHVKDEETRSIQKVPKLPPKAETKPEVKVREIVERPALGQMSKPANAGKVNDQPKSRKGLYLTIGGVVVILIIIFIWRPWEATTKRTEIGDTNPKVIDTILKIVNDPIIGDTNSIENIGPVISANSIRSLLTYGKDKFERTSSHQFKSFAQFKDASVLPSFGLPDTRTKADEKRLEELLEWIKMAQGKPGLLLKSIEINSYGSEFWDGTDTWKSWADARNHTVKNTYMSVFRKGLQQVEGYSESIYSEKIREEDWSGVKKVIQESSIGDRDLIIRVLELYQILTRMEEFRKLTATYPELKTEVLPVLNRTYITFSYEIIKSDKILLDQQKKDPTSLHIEEHLFLATLTEDLAEKIRLYKLAVNANKRDWRAFNNLGCIYLSSNSIEMAVSQLEKSAELTKKESVKYNLGLAYMLQGRYDLAEGLFGTNQKYIDLLNEAKKI